MVELFLLGVFIYVIWNIVHAKKTGRIHLGFLIVDRQWDDKSKLYKGVLLINLVWAFLLAGMLIWRIVAIVQRILR